MGFKSALHSTHKKLDKFKDSHSSESNLYELFKKGSGSSNSWRSSFMKKSSSQSEWSNKDKEAKEADSKSKKKQSSTNSNSTSTSSNSHSSGNWLKGLQFDGEGQKDNLGWSEKQVESICVLFPSYGVKIWKGRKVFWDIRVKGRAYHRPKDSRGNRWALAMARKYIGITKDHLNHESLKDRFNLFLDTKCVDLKLQLKVLGLTKPSLMDLSGEPVFVEEPDQYDEFEELIPNLCDLQINENKTLGSVDTSSSFPLNYSTNSSNNNKQIEPIEILVKDGHFSTSLHIPDQMIQDWREASNNKEDLNTILLQIPSIGKNPPVVGHVQLIEEEGISIISDIDDTIKDTGVHLGKKVAISNTLLNECKDVEGMSDIYKYWWLQGAQFHYVSNSPWQLFPLLEQFFEKYAFPSGSAHLKLFNWFSSKTLFYEPQSAKKASIRALIRDFPKRKFVLIGDSGEMDLEIYTAMYKEFPKNIKKIFIRELHYLPSNANSISSNNVNNKNNNSTSSSFSSNYSNGLRSSSSEPDLYQELKNTAKGVSSWLQSWIVAPDPRSPQKTSPKGSPTGTPRTASTTSSKPFNESWSRYDTSTSMSKALKFQQRLQKVSEGLHPDLITVFEQPSELLECPVVRQLFENKRF